MKASDTADFKNPSYIHFGCVDCLHLTLIIISKVTQGVECHPDEELSKLMRVNASGMWLQISRDHNLLTCQP